MDSDRVERVFPNPHGQLREIMTALYAQNVELVGAATTHFTWFPGYAWEVALCGQCATHLGWRYTAVDAETEPATFYGLLSSALVQGWAH